MKYDISALFKAYDEITSIPPDELKKQLEKINKRLIEIKAQGNDAERPEPLIENDDEILKKHKEIYNLVKTKVVFLKNNKSVCSNSCGFVNLFLRSPYCKLFDEYMLGARRCSKCLRTFGKD